jgi:cytochrome c oxidase assembly factor 2
MPPHLHPHSRLTTSLFTTTLVASFLVVGMPHIIPCPAPRTDFAEGEMNGEKRRRRKGIVKGAPEKRRECPEPKPKGLVGEVLGFTSKDEES